MSEFNSNLQLKDHLLICLDQACNDANSPLNLVDEIMDIIQYECDQGVIMNQLYFCKRESFMKHLMTCFHSPKDHLLHIGIESLQPRNVAYCGKHFLDLLVMKYWYQYILEKGQTIQEQIFYIEFQI